MSMQLGTLGTYPNDTGGFTYYKERNPLLNPNVWGSNFGMFPPTNLNANDFATYKAAAAVASALEGKVVPDPIRRGFIGNIPASEIYAIQLSDPDIPPVNAGNICWVLGDDSGRWGNARQKSEEICKEQFKIPVDWTIADRIYAALKTFKVI